MRADLRETLAYCTNLPSLPSVAIRVLEIGRQPDVSPDDLVELLGQDPALATRVLRVSNSPLYALQNRCRNLQQAVLALGLNATLTLALSFSLGDSMRQAGEHSEAIDRVWRRALIAGTAARILAQMLRVPRREDLFLAAMLQDLGVLALNAALPDTYPSLIARAATHDDLVLIEREALATDHGEVGTWLMERWGFPEPLVMAPTAAHEPQSVTALEEQRQFLSVVAISGRLADLFVSSRREMDTAVVAGFARQWLGVEADMLRAALDDVTEALPLVEQVFEARLISPEQAAAVLDQARELLAMRNLKLLQQAAEQQRRVTEMERSSQRWREKATRDALTGLHNRLFFDEHLEREIAVAAQEGQPLVLGFLDLDHFKEVNDAYGHDTGDVVLTTVGQTLRRHTRDSDLVVRYGGEEFIVLLPCTRLATAQGIFERLRRAIAAVEYTSPDNAVFRVTASIGIAAFMDEGHTEITQFDLVRRADRALYTAKQCGRNRVECADARVTI